jgi:hypothetical protein
MLADEMPVRPDEGEDQEITKQQAGMAKQRCFLGKSQMIDYRHNRTDEQIAEDWFRQDGHCGF